MGVKRGRLRRRAGRQVLAQLQPVAPRGLLEDESTQVPEERPQGAGR